MSMMEAMRAMMAEAKRVKAEAAAAEAAAEASSSSGAQDAGSDVSEDAAHRPVDPGLDGACAAAARYVAEGRDPLIAARRKHWYAAEACAPVALRGLLDAADVAEAHAAAAALAAAGQSARHFKDATAASTLGHAIVYLHAGGYFQARHARLFEKIERAMRSRAPASWTCCGRDEALRVRCIEHHTVSALLSDGHGGGRFVTYRDGRPQPHDLGAGDAVLFPSEKLHNIETVTSGVRTALVVELWRDKTNAKDRFQ